MVLTWEGSIGIELEKDDVWLLGMGLAISIIKGDGETSEVVPGGGAPGGGSEGGMGGAGGVYGCCEEPLM